MHVKDFFTKACILSTVGALLTGFGAIFAIFWLEFFESMLAKVSFNPAAIYKN